MSEKFPQKFDHYSPDAGLRLRDWIVGKEKHPPYILFNYAWSRMANLNESLAVTLAACLEGGNEKIIDIIEDAIAVEKTNGKDAAKVILENDLLEAIAGVIDGS